MKQCVHYFRHERIPFSESSSTDCDRYISTSCTAKHYLTQRLVYNLLHRQTTTESRRGAAGQLTPLCVVQGFWENVPRRYKHSQHVIDVNNYRLRAYTLFLKDLFQLFRHYKHAGYSGLCENGLHVSSFSLIDRTQTLSRTRSGFCPIAELDWSTGGGS